MLVEYLSPISTSHSLGSVTSPALLWENHYYAHSLKTETQRGEAAFSGSHSTNGGRSRGHRSQSVLYTVSRPRQRGGRSPPAPPCLRPPPAEGTPLGFGAAPSDPQPRCSEASEAVWVRAGAHREGREHRTFFFLLSDPEVPFSWSEEDLSDLYDHATILLAAEGESALLRVATHAPRPHPDAALEAAFQDVPSHCCCHVTGTRPPCPWAPRGGGGSHVVSLQCSTTTTSRTLCSERFPGSPTA